MRISTNDAQAEKVGNPGEKNVKTERANKNQNRES
jgi:hypothetical protein